jgi:5-methylthioadenosine/S-adenosylhomocysteine deaminase
MDQIIHAKWLFTGEATTPLLENHALVIQNGVIQAILPNQLAAERYPGTHQAHYATHLVMPGLINSHTHIAMNLLRGLADDLALMDWLNHHIWPAEKAWVSDTFVRDASELAIAEMIRSGTTCFNDMYFFLPATAEVAERAGIRASIGITVIGFPTAWAQDATDYINKGMAFYEQYKNHPRITTTFAPHSIYTVDEPTLAKIGELAEQYNLKINMHVQETATEVEQSLAQFKLRPLQRLDNLGLVSPRLIAVHMTQLNAEDLEIIAAKKPNIVHCPESNMKLASGACPVDVLQQLSINVALGTDGAASNNDLNMLGEMRSAAFLAKLVSRNPAALPTQNVLQMATLNGAKALGIDHITGSLAIGKSADFIAINLDEIETLPTYHPAATVLYAASRNQVTDVWVAGKQLMKNRELLTLNEAEIKAKAHHWQQKIKANA